MLHGVLYEMRKILPSVPGVKVAAEDGSILLQ